MPQTDTGTGTSPPAGSGVGEHCVTSAPLDSSIDPTGEVVRLEGIEFYVSKPGDIATAKPLIFLCNGAGIHSPNNQVQADKFASEGFLVAMPDLFDGDPVPPGIAFSAEEVQKLPLVEKVKLAAAEGVRGFMIDMWIAKHTTEKTTPILHKAVAAVKDAYPENVSNGVYAIGYCFGGKYVLTLAATDEIKAGAFAHGTLVTLADIQEVRQPVSFACVEGDPFFPDEVREAGQKHLERMGVPHEIKVYSGVPHGFAVLGYEKRTLGCKPEEAEAIKQAHVLAHDQMLDWLLAH